MSCGGILICNIILLSVGSDIIGNEVGRNILFVDGKPPVFPGCVDELLGGEFRIHAVYRYKQRVVEYNRRGYENSFIKHLVQYSVIDGNRSTLIKSDRPKH